MNGCPAVRFAMNEERDVEESMDYDNRLDNGKEKDRSRILVPSIVAALLVVAVVVGIVALNAGPDSAKADTTAVAAKNQKKPDAATEKKEKAPIPVDVARIESGKHLLLHPVDRESGG